MKIVFLGCLMLACALAVAQGVVPDKYQASPPKPDDVIARGNGQPIYAKDVEPLLWNWFGNSALDDYLSYVLVSQDAAKKGIVVADSEVQKAVDDELASIQKQTNGTPEQASDFLRQQGFTVSRLFLRLKVNLLVDKILQADFHQENFVKVATILVRAPSADAGQVADAIKKAQDAYGKLKAGQSWDAVLAATTTEKNLVASKGELGWRDLSLFPQSVQDEIKTLKVGEYTKPAQTDYGIQIFKVEAHGQDAKGAELDQLKAQYMSGARPRYMANLKANSKVEILLK